MDRGWRHVKRLDHSKREEDGEGGLLSDGAGAERWGVLSRTTDVWLRALELKLQSGQRGKKNPRQFSVEAAGREVGGLCDGGRGPGRGVAEGANAPLLIHTANRRIFDTLVKTTFTLAHGRPLRDPTAWIITGDKSKNMEGERKQAEM